jgi:hypothetical protein
MPATFEANSDLISAISMNANIHDFTIREKQWAFANRKYQKYGTLYDAVVYGLLAIMELR